MFLTAWRVLEPIEFPPESYEGFLAGSLGLRGPDADTIRIGILRAEIKRYLRDNGIAFKPDIREPVRMPELDESGDWWERNDLTAQCYILFSRDYTEGIIEHVPVTVTSKDDSVEVWANPIIIPDTDDDDKDEP